MKIKKIVIKNFRGIESLNVDNLDKNINLIVGVNGAGKTSFLESLAIMLSWLIARLKTQNGKGKPIAEKDIKLGEKNCFVSITLDDETELSLCQTLSYTSHKAKSQCVAEMTQATDWARKTLSEVEAGGGAPVMMFYPVERSIAAAPVNLHRNSAEPTIWDIYKGALTGNADFRSMFEWYRRQEDAENELIRDNAEYRDRCLTAVRNAISAFFPGFTEMRVRRRPYQAMVVRKDEQEIEFTQLSQGEKCYLSLVCDIARRLAMANPEMENPLMGEGVILIDEVDLHLHPKWQSEVASKLMTVFPNCQFILSTHSAFVLSDLRKEQVLPFSGGKLIDNSFNPYGKLSSQILTNYFEISHQRNNSVAKDIDDAYTALKSNDRQRFEQLFGKLKEILGIADSDVIGLLVEAKHKDWL